MNHSINTHNMHQGRSCFIPFRISIVIGMLRTKYKSQHPPPPQVCEKDFFFMLLGCKFPSFVLPYILSHAMEFSLILLTSGLYVCLIGRASTHRISKDYHEVKTWILFSQYCRIFADLREHNPDLHEHNKSLILRG
jgi:hypothetical protein